MTNYKEEKHEESSVVSLRRRIIKKYLNISRGAQRNFGGYFQGFVRFQVIQLNDYFFPSLPLLFHDFEYVFSTADQG